MNNRNINSQKLILLIVILVNAGVCFMTRSIFLLICHVLLALLSLARLLELMLAIKAPTNSGKLVAWIIISVPATVLVFKLAGYFGSMGWLQIVVEVVMILFGFVLLLNNWNARSERRKNP